MSYLRVFLDMTIVGIFLASVVGKVRSRAAFHAFVGAVRDLGGIPVRWVRAAAAFVVVLEAAAAVLVALPAAITTIAGLTLAAGLLVAFTVVLVRALRRAPGPACHCFGGDGDAVAPRHVVRNLVLLGGCAAGVVMGPSTEGAREPAGLALCALVAGVCVGAVALLDDLAALLRPAKP
ncbi:MauE/DoxX family redox-associated membrane protein [Dactylosporangium sp. CA-139066]|uniref:MauE/DoxX family redox-associated membrane protein n=1 Tax=Dactylosporangium sp. CA-139066 TaxID=3239930 RepID=UPI003D8D4041